MQVPRNTPGLRAVALRTAFELLYHQFAWAYDWVSGTFFAGQWRLWQRAAIPPLAGVPGRRVLEVGCGTGDLQHDLAAAGYTPVGIDRSPQMLRVARRKARSGGSSLRTARAEARALPFADATFAAVVSTFPSEYIFDPRTLAEIWRVLVPGGRLVIVPAGALLPVNRTARVLDQVAQLVYGGGKGRARQEATRRAQVLARFTQAPAFGPLVPNLEAAGFVVSVQTGVNPASVVLVVLGAKA
ncbi:MAG TPA: methyltransferase domain-containing protein [Chloroflexia bacterium]|nr:methyltransferase domain-containing protein [Chloroflexia bacterium]